MEELSLALTAALPDLTEEQLARFCRYEELLREWNEKMNLTALKGAEDTAQKHFADSVPQAVLLRLAPGARGIDVGTGAGFPGVPLLILRPDLKLTLLDSLNKRLLFLAEVLRELHLSAELVHARAEDAARLPQHRERYDFALSRAVAPLNVLSELTLPFLRVGGEALCYKGPAAAEELVGAKRALTLLHGSAEVLSADAPWGERRIVVLRKQEKTPKAYPRKAGTPSRDPL